MNLTTQMASGTSRNSVRDEIFTKMCELGSIACKSTLSSFGSTLAEIATGHGMKHLIHDSDYVAYKARKVLSSIVTDDNVLGCFMGCGVGDAVGLPVEGYGRDICNSYVQEIVQKQQISSYHRHDFTFGQYSDDTQLTREMFLTVLQGKGKIDPAVYALRIALLFQPGAYRVVGYGKQTANAALAIRNGVHYTESGCAKGQGNGSVMRSACVGVLLAGMCIEDIAHTARVMSAITHASKASIDGSIAIALAANFALLTRNAPFDPLKLVEYICICETISDEFKSYVQELGVLVNEDLPTAASRIIDIGISNGERKWGDGISIGARQTALWALWSFMKSPDSYVDCISYAIAVGGDVDTTAATAGALVGTRVGMSNIPSIWMEALHDYSEWKYDELVNVCKNVSKLIASGSIKV